MVHQQETINGVPHDVGAEQAVIGAMLQSASATPAVMQILKTEDFYRPIHASLHALMIDMYVAGEAVGDPLVIADRATETGLIKKLPDPAYLYTCIAAVPSVANVGHYARIVAGHAESRRLIEAGARISQIGRLAERENRHAEAANILSAACLTGNAKASTIGDILPATLREMESGRQPGPSTGFSDLDRLLYGLNEGVLVIAGRPGMGKSTAAMDFARSFAIRQKINTLFFAMEMGRDQLLQRIISAETKIPHHNITRGGNSLHARDWEKIAEATPRIHEAPLTIDDDSAVTIHDICARTKLHAARGDLGLVVVDHIGLCATVPGSRSSRTEEIGTITRGLNALSKDLHIPVIAVCQLNRGPEQRTDRRPQLSDLRESGNIEQDASIVMFVHRDDYYDKESPRLGEADFIVAKHRNGPLADITVAAQLHCSRFVDMAVE